MKPLDIVIDFKEELFLNQKETASELGVSLASVIQSILNIKLMPKNPKVLFKDYENHTTPLGSKLRVFHFECTPEIKENLE